MAGECLLRAANGTPGTACDEERCAFWESIGMTHGEGPACAVQRFGLLDADDKALAAWLLSVKERVAGLSEEK